MLNECAQSALPLSKIVWGWGGGGGGGLSFGKGAASVVQQGVVVKTWHSFRVSHILSARIAEAKVIFDWSYFEETKRMNVREMGKHFEHKKK